MQRSDPAIIRQNAPESLRALPQWVCWREEERDGKPTKVPVCPGAAFRASSTDATHWRTFDEALSAFEKDPSLLGVGFVFAEGAGLCGVDLDDCRDASTGDIAPWAQKILDALASYAEISPSGTGVKAFVRATKPGTKCRKAYATGEVEMYDSQRFFTVTGQHVTTMPATVEDRQEAIEAIYIEVFGKKASPTESGAASDQTGLSDGTPTPTPAPVPATATTPPADSASSPSPVILTDDEIVALISSPRKRKAKFAALWAGQWQGHYPSPSEADGALVFDLAFYTKDPAQIDRLFRRSGLFRDKWDDRRGDSTIGKDLIADALSQVKAQYRPRGQRRTHARRAASSAPQAGTVDPTTGRLILDTDRTLPTAEAFVRQFCTHPEGCMLRHYASILFFWHENRYAEIEEDAAKHRLLPWLASALRPRYSAQLGEWTLVDFPANPHTVNAALESIRAYTHLAASTKTPRWLDSRSDRPPAQEMLACKSALLHLPTMTRHAPTPAFFTLNALNYDPDPSASAPTQWLVFLGQLFGNDKQSIELLQDWFGYCLTGDTSQQKMLLLVGPKRCGKGTIARVLTQLVGPSNVCGPTTSSLATDFGLQPLIGKTLAIVSDARFSGDRVQTVVERLLCISGEDLLTIDRKHLSSVSMQLPARFVFLTNEIPRLVDTSGALAGRFMVLKFTESFFGREDKLLTVKLLRELPGILNWAIEGWRRLQHRGRFIQPESVEGVLDSLEELSSPVGAFVKECCVVGAVQRGYVAEIFAAFCLWSKWQGCNSTPTKQTFGRNIQAAVPSLVARRNHGEGRFYEGIALTSEFQKLVATRREDEAERNQEHENREIANPWEDE